MTGRPVEKHYDEVFHWIGGFIQENGYAPSVREIMRECNLHSTSYVSYILERLEEDGRISRAGNLPRTIVIREAL